MATPKTTSTATVATGARAKMKRALAHVAAAFEWSLPGMGGVNLPVWLAPKGGRTMIDMQKGRNNYYTMDGRTQASVARRMAARNWFLRPVLALRHASQVDGFMAVAGDGTDMKEQYDFRSLVHDIVHENLITSNVVCLWRKGEKLPTITVLDAEAVDYRAVGGAERITVQYAKDEVLARDKENEADYIRILGERVFKAYKQGGSVTFIKGADEEWDFEVMVEGKRRGVFGLPPLVPVMDTLDFLELMGIADWNLAWFRKDVIRVLRKGYKVTNGAGAGINSIDITSDDVAKLGDGFSKLIGNANVPMNHDVEASYLTVGPENFKPEQVESAIDRLMLFGGIEAVVLLSSFSQQNGAAPSLMRNARTTAFALRERVELLLQRIFAADEFKDLDWGGGEMRFRWSVKSLYSIEEVLLKVKGTNDGTASMQTRREWMDLDNDVEVDRLKASHADREGYAPPFEAGQALLPAMFPDLAPASSGETPPAPPGEPGRPPKTNS